MIEGFSTFWQILVVLLIGLLFFREDIMPVIRKWLGMETKGIPATSGQFEQLTEYVNHQQTEILKRQTQLMEAILEIVRDIRRKQEEYDKYGINARCNSDKSE